MRPDMKQRTMTAGGFAGRAQPVSSSGTSSQARPSTHPRQSLIDMGRGLSILAISLVALAQGPGAGHAPILDLPVRVLASLAAPAFFLLSGLAISLDIRLPLRAFLDRRILPLLWVFPLWAAIDQFLSSFAPAPSLPALLAAVGPVLWITAALPAFALLTRLVRHLPLGIVLALVLLLELLRQPELGGFSLGLASFVAFFLGTRAPALPLRLARCARTQPLVAFAGVAAVGAAALLMTIVAAPLAGTPSLAALPFAGLGLSIAGAGAMAVLAAQIGETDLGPWLGRVGAHWCPVYLAIVPLFLALTTAASIIAPVLPPDAIARLGMLGAIPAAVALAPLLHFMPFAVSEGVAGAASEGRGPADR
jgi:uncharacterized membrane protein YcfT